MSDGYKFTILELHEAYMNYLDKFRLTQMVCGKKNNSKSVYLLDNLCSRMSS